jgi:hypothetical protein
MRLEPLISPTGILMTFYLSIILDLQNFFHSYILQSWKLKRTHSYLDLYLEFDDSGQISTKIYDKRDDFNFKIINFPNMCSNIPASAAYGVYISQLIRYARASSNYSDFLQRRQICYWWGTPAYWSLVPRSSMFYLFEFCLKNMWNCSLTQHILSHSCYDWKLCELFLLSGFLICHVVGW